ncbi:MAG: fibronectin type III domain-containing protein, partial [archaeon]
DYGVVHNKSITVPDGSHTYYIRCSDGSGNEMNESAIISFAVDSMPPTITESFISPSGIVEQDYAYMTVKTNEDSTCRFDDEDDDYNDLSRVFSQTGQTEHVHMLEDLGSGDHTYYVRCKDEFDNEMQASEILEFEVNRPPTASVSIEGGFSIKVGTHKVTLQTSEQLISTPLLQYQYQGQGGKISISLTGSGSHWIGYIVVPSSTTDKIGTFYFEGKDLEGVEGTDITSGKIFIVDTTKPPKPTSIKAELDEDEIKVEWHYDGEDIEYFNVYRSTNEGVDYVDLYEEDEDNEYFKDDDIIEGKTYYYRVTAVDKAGNEGLLSDEVFVQYKTEQGEEDEEGTLLSRTLERELNKTIIEVEKDILDVDWAISNLEKMTDQEKVKFINKLELVSKARDAKEDLEAALAELESWKYEELDKTEFNKKKDSMKLDIARYKTNVAIGIDIHNRVEYDQHYDETTLLSVLNNLVKNSGLTDSQKMSFEKESKQLQDKVIIKGSIISGEVFYMNRENGEEMTLFEKKVIAEESLDNVLIVEYVPKQVEEDASNINFGTTPEVVKKDPIVKWSFVSVSSEEIYYFIDGIVDLNIGQTTFTFVFPQVPRGEASGAVDGGDDGGDSITGHSVEDVGSPEFNLNKFLIGMGVVVIVGLLVYYFFFMKIEEDYEDMAVKSKASRRRNSNWAYSLVTTMGDWFKPNPKIIPMPEKLKSAVKENKAEAKGPDNPVPVVGDEDKHYFHHHLDKANFIADSTDFDDAFVMYNRLLGGLKETNLPPEERILIEKGTNKLYSKLVLLSKVREGHRCIDKNDVISLNHVMEQIKPLLELVGEDNFETKLVKHGVDSFKYFQDVSKGMDFFG